MYQSGISAPNNEVLYSLPYPKYTFLNYILLTKNVLIHGSNKLEIKRLVPKEQGEYDGNMVNAVFASKDSIWSIFFAILDRSSYFGGIRNACIVIGSDDSMKRFFFFSLEKEGLSKQPWREGMIYIIPNKEFVHTSKGVARFDEWISKNSTEILMKIKVSSNDFPFFNKICGHKKGELMIRSWFLYKIRLRRKVEQ